VVGSTGCCLRTKQKIVHNIVFGSLIGSAGDLHLINQLRHPKRAVREVAALGRLAY